MDLLQKLIVPSWLLFGSWQPQGTKAPLRAAPSTAFWPPGPFCVSWAAAGSLWKEQQLPPACSGGRPSHCCPAVVPARR